MDIVSVKNVPILYLQKQAYYFKYLFMFEKMKKNKNKNKRRAINNIYFQEIFFLLQIESKYKL